MNAGMKRSLILVAVAALAIAARKQPPSQPLPTLEGKSKEVWCIGPITALDAHAGLFTVMVKSQGESVQPQTEGPRFLGSFIVASSSAASEEQRSFQCAPQCQFATQEKKAGATLADFKMGDMVQVNCATTNAPWIAVRLVHHTPAQSRK